MVGRRRETKSGKIPYLFGYYVNLLGFTRKWIFQNLIFQLHPIITPLILDQFACSLPNTNTTFYQLFKYVKKEEFFSSIRGENGRNIFGPCSLRSTVKVGDYVGKCCR